MSITVVQITDTHIHDQQDVCFKNTHPDISLNAIIQHAISHLSNIDCVVITGDLTHDGGAAACSRLAKLLSQFSCPVYVTLGNHDAAEIIQQHLLNAQISMPETIAIQNWQLLFADSHIEYQAAGCLTEQTIQRLDAQLQQCQHPSILFTHHPPVKIGSQWMDDIGMKNGEHVLQKLCTHKNLLALVFGHIHQQWHSQYQHIEILGTPSSCVQFKVHSEEFAIDDNLAGYRVFHLHDNGDFDSQVFRQQV